MKRLRKLRSFTLIELLVVVAIIALLISILLPSLSRARELSKRTVCLSNIRGIGQACHIYAQDGEVFPAYSGTDTSGQMRCFLDRSGTGGGPPSTTAVPSPTVDLWMLLRTNNTTVKQFICPSTIDQPDPAQDTTAYYDFQTALNLSYGYQWQHASAPRILGPSSPPQYPVLADGNPYTKGSVASQLLADICAQWKGNSTNHTGREVSNVLFIDAHAESAKSACIGLVGAPFGGCPTATTVKPQPLDNIFSIHIVNQPVCPGSTKPTYTQIGIPGGNSDSILVP